MSLFLKHSSALWAVAFILLLSYIAAAIMYPVIELDSPFRVVFFPTVLIFSFAFTLHALHTKQPKAESFNVGFVCGMIVSLVLFLSNICISEPYTNKYTVTEVKIGRGKAVNWILNIDDRKEIMIYVRLKDVDMETSPDSVILNLRKGWLGYIFGDKA